MADGLVEVLLRELAPRTAAGRQPGAAYEPGVLPLLSHALLATWEHSRGGRLTVADYQAGGGISGAIARTAEKVYAGLTDGQQDMTRRLFLRLVHVADDAPVTRSTVELSDLPGRHDGEDVSDLLDRFAAARLITLDTGTAQITHDALLTAWPRLRAWTRPTTRTCGSGGASASQRGPGPRPGETPRRCCAAASWPSPGLGGGPG